MLIAEFRKLRANKGEIKKIMDLLGSKIRGTWGGVLFFLIPALLFLVCAEQGLVDPTLSDLKTQVEIAEISGSVTSLAIGGESSVISVSLEDGTGTAFSGVVVSFDALIGSITPSDTSDENGIAQGLSIQAEPMQESIQ